MLTGVVIGISEKGTELLSNRAYSLQEMRSFTMMRCKYEMTMGVVAPSSPNH